MTLMQIISTGLAAFCTLYFGQVLFRTKTLQPLNGIQVGLWIAAVMFAVVSWVGMK